MRRSGFTLFEMVLVLLLVVVAASLASPLLDTLLHPNQVTAAIDAVTVNLEQARSRAIEEGRPFRFSIVEGGNTFRIEPDDAATNTDAGYTIDGELPESCLFVENGTGVIEQSSQPSAGGLKSIAVFLPDGTARDNVDISFGRPGLVRATLRLRALTGSVSLVTQPKEATP